MCTVSKRVKSEVLIFYFLTQDIMSKKLFVGNIAWETSNDQLQELFSQYGEVEEAIIIKDKFSGRSKGFGFVTFVNDEDADKATSELHEKDYNGRNLVVNEAKPPRPRD